MYDWLLGDDPQWMRCVDDDCYTSHDHGLYLGQGSDWSGLKSRVDEKHPLGQDAAGLDADEIQRLDERLQAVTREEIAEALESLPDDWPISVEELKAVIDVADQRCGSAAERLRALVV